jgi:hypothetical protein
MVGRVDVEETVSDTVLTVVNLSDKLGRWADPIVSMWPAMRIT